MTYRDVWSQSRRFVSDKWDHYFEIYDHSFGKFYGKRINYLEIGVQRGGSLETASQIFHEDSRIIGLDIDPRCKELEQYDICEKIFVGSQVDDGVLAEMLHHCDSFDVIIDDGSHIQSDMIKTFIKLFPFLNPNGVYLIEDTHTNFSPAHQDSFFGIGLYDYMKGLCERLNLAYLDSGRRKIEFKRPRTERLPEERADALLSNIFSIEFFESVIVVKKQKRPEPLRTVL